MLVFTISLSFMGISANNSVWCRGLNYLVEISYIFVKENKDVSEPTADVQDIYFSRQQGNKNNNLWARPSSWSQVELANIGQAAICRGTSSLLQWIFLACPEVFALYLQCQEFPISSSVSICQAEPVTCQPAHVAPSDVREERVTAQISCHMSHSNTVTLSGGERLSTLDTGNVGRNIFVFSNFGTWISCKHFRPRMQLKNVKFPWTICLPLRGLEAHSPL